METGTTLRKPPTFRNSNPLIRQRPALKNAQVFGGIAGIIAGEPVEADDSGRKHTTFVLWCILLNLVPDLPTLSKTSHENGELQDMYRRTEIAFWAAQPGELRADECIEDIFGGGDGWGGSDGKQPGDRLGVEGDSASLSDSGSRSPRRAWHRHTPSQGSNKSADTLKRARMAGLDRGLSMRGRASLEQQANQMKAEAHMPRSRPAHEVDELDVRDDLRSWTLSVH